MNSSTSLALARKFRNDLREIATELIVGFGLLHSANESSLGDPLIRWLDFRLRLIEPRPRQIYASDKFPLKLPTKEADALEKIQIKIAAGEDINAHQSKTLVLNDTSGKKRPERTDLLWADWAIHHLHLNVDADPKEPYFSQRSGYLLFLLASEDWVALIDALGHNESEIFSCKELIGTVARNWPELMERYELKGILPSAPLAAKDIKLLRRGGVSAPLMIDGKVYIGPGLGITTASTSTRVSLVAAKMDRYCRALAEMVINPDGQFFSGGESLSSGEKSFKLAISPLGLAVFEEGQNIAWPLPASTNVQNARWLVEFRNFFTSNWILSRLRV